MYECLQRDYGLSKLLAVEVDHCPFAFACMLVTESPTSIEKELVYSGDTVPCQNLINYAKNCKVLIHESSLETGLEKDAFQKRHSTAAQALQVSRKVKAWRTIFTHFSVRYPKMMPYTQ